MGDALRPFVGPSLALLPKLELANQLPFPIGEEVTQSQPLVSANTSLNQLATNYSLLQDVKKALLSTDISAMWVSPRVRLRLLHGMRLYNDMLSVMQCAEERCTC